MFDVRSLNLTIRQFPRADRILVLPLVQASSSPILDMEPNREQPEKGLVLAVGPGGIGVQTGRAIPVLATVGELVVYGKYAGHKWEIDGPPDADGRVRPVVAYIMSDAEVMLFQPADTLDLIVHDGLRIHEVGKTCEHCPGPDLKRLQALARGDDPNVPVDLDAAIAAERARPQQGADEEQMPVSE